MADIPVNAVVIKNDKKYIKQSLDKPNNSNTTGTRVGDVEKKIGDMSALKTTAKDTIVEAINEAKESGGYSVEIVDDLVTDDSNKALSAKQGKLLNDNKFDKSDAEVLSSQIAGEIKDYVNTQVLPKTATEISSPLVPNTEYYLGETENLTISLPSGELGQYCFVKFKSGAAATQITVEGDNIVGDIPTPIANKTYEIIANWNGEKWVCAYRGY